MIEGPSRLPGDLLLARLGCKHLLRMLSTVSQLFDGDLILGVVFIAINQAATDHLNLTRTRAGRTRRRSCRTTSGGRSPCCRSPTR